MAEIDILSINNKKIQLDSVYDTLTTENKKIIPAINELNSQFKDIAKQTITNEERTKLSSLENYDDTGIKNDIQIQKARIDSFTSLKEGSTTGDAELIDGRIGADGTTYSNVGNAIRNQLKNIIDGTKINKYDNKLNSEPESGGLQYILTNSTDAKMNYSTDVNGYKHYIISQDSSNSIFGMVVGGDYRNCTFSKGQEFLMSYKSTVEFKVNFRSFDSSNNKLDDIWKVIPKGSGNIIIKYTDLNPATIKLAFVQAQTTTITSGSIDIYNFRVYNINDDISLKQLNININTIKNLLFSQKNWYNGKIASALGDSITFQGYYQSYVKELLSLAEYKNCGISGSNLSHNKDDSFWKDIRVNSLDINSNIITIMAGTNDVNHANTVQDSDFTLSNCNTNNIIGAYNVLLSKIYYKYLKVDGYYSSIDYSGVIQVDNALQFKDFIIILIAPPKRFDGEEYKWNESVEKINGYVKKIAEMWGLPCVDAGSLGINDISRIPLWTTNGDMLHPPKIWHSRLAKAIYEKAREIEPIE